ncbi:RNA chaperone ProQ [Glaciecola sp. 1036]|uniref:RNA chaperone ProQ n=1 Tax=Alteromonadaceae TaxID=72275 RepID=UPI003CFF7A13
MVQEKLSNTKDTLAYLCSQFPKCFTLDGDVKPLKIGIFKDLAERLDDSEIVSKRLLRMSLRHYTSSWKYLASVKEGSARIDLDGIDGDLVEAEHAEHAAVQLKESKQRAAEKRQQQKQEKAKSSPPKHKKPRSFKKPDSKDNTNITHKKKRLAVNKIADDELKVGLVVSVKVGKQPMPAVVTEVSKDGVFVQLNSGMSVKVTQDQLRTVSKS